MNKISDEKTQRKARPNTGGQEVRGFKEKVKLIGIDVQRNWIPTVSYAYSFGCLWIVNRGSWEWEWGKDPSLPLSYPLNFEPCECIT